MGRFKAGKSSFLNHLIGREVLPVGVVPVTAVVTEIQYGSHERAAVHGLDGTTLAVCLDQIAGYISESENPENTKQVERITIDLPELRRFTGLKFVDTPGLGSALAHNTRTSLDWLPHVGLAFVTIGVDPPLSLRDIELIQSVYRYTPQVFVLLTKADLLNQRELAEVVEFVRSQLSKHLPGTRTPPILPYSTRPGFDSFRTGIEELIGETMKNLSAGRTSIASRKLETLLGESSGYLTLSLRSAERVQSQRRVLARELVGEKESRDAVRSQIRLVVQEAATKTRSLVSMHLETCYGEIRENLDNMFESEFPKWTSSLATMLTGFDQWLERNLREQLALVSARDHEVFLRPLHHVRKQIFDVLQLFRDRLSERSQQVFGIALRTTETAIHVSEPSTPDVRIGRIFDRNWELLSPILPVWIIRGIVRRHFEREIAYLLYQNLSRLSSQWEESIHHGLRAIEQESGRRIDELIGTVERLLAIGDERVPQIRADLEQLRGALDSLAQTRGQRD